MEINQESSSPKPLTKSSRKRQRKKITAALKKLEDYVNSESVQSQDPKSETKKEYLREIVTSPTLRQKTETSKSKLNAQDALKPKYTIISCGGAETISSDIPERNASNPNQELPVSQSKRKRNRKKNTVNTVRCEGHEVSIVSPPQETVNVPKCLAHNTSQKDCISKLNKLASLSPLNIQYSSEIPERSTSEPNQELPISQSKRKRNRKKNIVNTVSCEGHEVSVVSPPQETVNVPKCLAHNSSEKDCNSKLNKLGSLTPLNVDNIKIPVLDKNTQSLPTNPAVKTDQVTDSKLKEVDSLGKEQSLPSTKKRQNRKKENSAEAKTSTQCGNIECKKVKELADQIPKPSPKQLPSQEDREEPKKENSLLENSVSRLEDEVIGKNLQLDKTDVKTKTVSTPVIGAKKLPDRESGNSSAVIEKSEQKDKRTVEVSNKKCDLGVVIKKSSDCSKDKVCRGESEEKDKEVLNCKLVMDSDLRSDIHKSGAKVDVNKSSTPSGSALEREVDESMQKEQNQSLFVFQQTGIYCSHTSHTAADASCCSAVAGAALGKVDSIKETPVAKMNKDQGKNSDKSSGQVPSVPENKSEIKSDALGEVVMAINKVSLKDNNKEEHKTDAQNATESQEDGKEKLKAEREARKAAKLAKKKKAPGEAKESGEKTMDQVPQVPPGNKALVGDKTDEVVVPKCDAVPTKSDVTPSKEAEGGGKSKAELRAERRAKQEAQRAAKALQSSAAPSQAKGKSAEEKSSKIVVQENKKKEPNKRLTNEKVVRKEQGDKLLSRLGWDDGRVKKRSSESATLRDTQVIHPAIVQLSTRFTNRIISGSNARCLAFVQAIKKAILDYQTPSQKELGRDLDSRLLTPSLAYLEAQRPHAVSVSNATKFLKWQLTKLQPVQPCSPDSTAGPYSETRKSSIITDEEAKKCLIDGLDAYVWEKIKVAEEAVCETLKDKIRDGDVILTYGCSYLLQQILMGAKRGGTKFKVIVVDGRPWREGREMLRCLVAVGIPCSYVLLSAASTVMRQVNKVLLGAHALLSNGYVMSRVGVSQVALLASAHNVPVLVACETHKFCERVQSDSFVYNEMGEPDGLAQLLGGEDGPLSGWRNIPNLSLLNVSYDVTPPELVTAVATELAVLPCTSVPVVLRVRPTEPIASRH